MKKLISTVLTFALGVTMFCGCKKEDDVTIRIGSLSGPTTIGIINMMNDTMDTNNSYDFTIATQPDEIAASLNAGDLDIALIPANLASILYNRTEGGIQVIDINTYGVLYCITTDPSITSVSDLSGKTVITTGQGATPEYAMNYLLEQYGVTDCTLDFKTEGSEVIASLQEDPSQIAVLPQPAATAAMVQIEGMNIAFSLDEAWSDVSDSRLVTGVTVVRKEFLDQHPDAVASFIVDHHNSVVLCNIDCVASAQMRTDLEGYLQTLYDANPQSVGGAMPGDDFYHVG